MAIDIGHALISAIEIKRDSAEHPGGRERAGEHHFRSTGQVDADASIRWERLGMMNDLLVDGSGVPGRDRKLLECAAVEEGFHARRRIFLRVYENMLLRCELPNPEQGRHALLAKEVKCHIEPVDGIASPCPACVVPLEPFGRQRNGLGRLADNRRDDEPFFQVRMPQCGQRPDKGHDRRARAQEECDELLAICLGSEVQCVHGTGVDSLRIIEFAQLFALETDFRIRPRSMHALFQPAGEMRVRGGGVGESGNEFASHLPVPVLARVMDRCQRCLEGRLGIRPAGRVVHPRVAQHDDIRILLGRQCPGDRTVRVFKPQRCAEVGDAIPGEQELLH